MPYDNKLNRSLASEMRKNIEAYIKNNPMSYDVNSTVGNSKKELLDNSNIEQKRVELEDREEMPDNELTGGSLGAVSGFARGTFRDTGHGSVKGIAGMGRIGYGHPDSMGSGLMTHHNMEGAGWLSSLGKGLKSVVKNFAAPASAVLGMIPLPQAQLASKGIGLLGNVVGNGKSKKGVSKEKELLLTRTAEGGRKKRISSKKADNKSVPVVSDIGILNKFTEGMQKKRGRPSKMKGGGADLAEPYNMVNEKGITGSGKRIVGGTKLVPQANMKSSSMAGQGKGNKRSDIVKEIMKKRGVSMIQASSIVKNEGLYKKK